MRLIRTASSRPGKLQQRGAALFIVLVLVLLAMLLGLWASRASLFNELVVSNDADYQRAFETAQALLTDAELDIRGLRADGRSCTANPGNGDICRRTTADQFPLEAQDVTRLLASLDDLKPQPLCRNGLCAKRVGLQDFWNDQPTMTAMHSSRAQYGQYTGALVTTETEAANIKSNPLLRSGGYWVEVLPYLPNAAAMNLIVPDEVEIEGVMVASVADVLPLQLEPSVVYRITAVAQGRRANTRAVLQQTLARQRLKD